MSGSAAKQSKKQSSTRQVSKKQPPAPAPDASDDADSNNELATIEHAVLNASGLPTSTAAASNSDSAAPPSDGAELLRVLNDLKSQMTELKKFVTPVLTKMQSHKLPTSKGMSFLEVKAQLLLSYCTHAVFYLLLKAEGKSVAAHPVIDQMVAIRVVLEKIRPIDKRLKYQIDKLLKAAALGPAVPAASTGSAGGAVITADGDSTQGM